MHHKYQVYTENLKQVSKVAGQLAQLLHCMHHPDQLPSCGHENPSNSTQEGGNSSGTACDPVAAVATFAAVGRG